MTELLREALKRINDAFNVAIPLHAIRTRQGAGGKIYRYIRADYIWNTLLESELVWEWHANDPVVINGAHGTVIGFVLKGNLTIEGITRSGVGYAGLKTNKEGAVDLVDAGTKDCETDAFKRAAARFGRALGFELVEQDYQPEAEAAPEPKPQTPPNGKPVYADKAILNIAKEPMTPDRARNALGWALKAIESQPTNVHGRILQLGFAVDQILDFLNQTAENPNAELPKLQQATLIAVWLVAKPDIWNSPEATITKSFFVNGIIESQAIRHEAN